MMSAEFGSRTWLLQQLRHILKVARAESTRLYTERGMPSSIDYDEYSYIELSRRKRNLWSLLVELAGELPWLHLDSRAGNIMIQPECEIPWRKDDHSIDERVAEVLRRNGIPVTTRVHYRD